MPIVYGLDFSEPGTAGASAAAAIAYRMGEELSLVHVIEGPAQERTERSTPEGDAMVRLSEQAARLKRQFGDFSVRVAVLRGSAAQKLVEFAEAQHASLLVVSSHGHQTAPLLRVGGTSERVAVESSRPVLVLRHPDVFVSWARGDKPLRVLVGVDDSDTSRAAIAWVKTLRQAGACDVVAAHVYHVFDARHRYGIERLMSWVERDPELEALLERDVAALVGALPGSGGLAIRPQLGVGRPADHLLELAERERVDVVVLGTHQRGGVARLASVSQTALHFGRMAVACIPSPAGSEAAPEHLPDIRRVLVPTDFSVLSNRAIPYALSLAPAGSGEVFLLHIAEGPGPLNPEEEVDIRARLREAAAPAAARKRVSVRTEVVRSLDVADAIRAAAERLGAHVICMASHGRSGVVRAVLGSVAAKVVTQSRQPVLIVRPPAQ